MTNIGGKLRCSDCGHERVITSKWLDGVCSKFSLGNFETLQWSSFEPRLKCSKCGAKKVKLINSAAEQISDSLRAVNTVEKNYKAPERDREDKADSPSRWKKKACPACGGNGLDGHCYKCLGTGWMDDPEMD